MFDKKEFSTYESNESLFVQYLLYELVGSEELSNRKRIIYNQILNKTRLPN